MQIYKLKFKKKQLNIVFGVIWDLLSLFWTILLIVYFAIFKPELSVGTVFMTICMILYIILGFLLGNYRITLSSRAYIKIYDKELEIYKGLARRNQFIKFEDIEKVHLSGEKIVIILMDYCSNKEVEIMLDLMYLKDLDILLNNFSKNNILVKGL